MSTIHTLYKIGAVRFGQFTLKSGQHSLFYLDLRRIISYPELMQKIANQLWEHARHCQFDLLCGVPYTALPLATALSLTHHVPMVMRRKEQKEYGTKQKIEGVYQPGQRCLIIEDVITSGSSILETANDLTNAGLVIKDVLVFVDREQGGKANLAQHHYQIQSVYTLSEILTSLFQSNILAHDESAIVEKLLAEKAG